MVDDVATVIHSSLRHSRVVFKSRNQGFTHGG
jgi:hypothetical protein